MAHPFVPEVRLRSTVIAVPGWQCSLGTVSSSVLHTKGFEGSGVKLVPCEPPPISLTLTARLKYVRCWKR